MEKCDTLTVTWLALYRIDNIQYCRWSEQKCCWPVQCSLLSKKIRRKRIERLWRNLRKCSFVARKKNCRQNFLAAIFDFLAAIFFLCRKYLFFFLAAKTHFCATILKEKPDERWTEVVLLNASLNDSKIYKLFYRK